MKATSRIAALGAIALLCLSASAFAAGVQCNDNGTQQQMNACAARDYQAADRVLNQTYKSVIATLSPRKVQQLRQEQRAWLKRRDPQCREEVKDSEGGSVWPLEYQSCLRAATEQRSKELERWRATR